MIFELPSAWLYLLSDSSLHFYADESKPETVVWRWPVVYLEDEMKDNFTISASHVQNIINGWIKKGRKPFYEVSPVREDYRFCKKCPRGYLCEYQIGNRPFDSEYAMACFGKDASKSVIAVQGEISKRIFSWAVRNTSYRDMDALGSHLGGMVDAHMMALREFWKEDNPCAWRNIQLKMHAAVGLLNMVVEFLCGNISSSCVPALRISSSCRDFSNGWKNKFDVFFLKDTIKKDHDGEMRGIVNLDTGDYEEACKVFEMIASRKSDRRSPSFECLKIAYPENMPDREEIIADIETVLEKYGMKDFPFIWVVSRKQGNKFVVYACICRIPRFPDKNGLYLVPDGLVVEGNHTNWAACRQAAAFAISEKRGFPVNGLSYNDNGGLIGKPIHGKYAR